MVRGVWLGETGTHWCGGNLYVPMGCFYCGREPGTGWYRGVLSYGLVIHLGGSMDSGMVVGMARGGLCFVEGKVLVGIGENLCSLMDWFCLWLGGEWCVVGSKKWCL